MPFSSSVPALQSLSLGSPEHSEVNDRASLGAEGGIRHTCPATTICSGRIPSKNMNPFQNLLIKKKRHQAIQTGTMLHKRHTHFDGLATIESLQTTHSPQMRNCWSSSPLGGSSSSNPSADFESASSFPNWAQPCNRQPEMEEVFAADCKDPFCHSSHRCSIMS